MRDNQQSEYFQWLGEAGRHPLLSADEERAGLDGQLRRVFGDELVELLTPEIHAEQMPEGVRAWAVFEYSRHQWRLSQGAEQERHIWTLEGEEGFFLRPPRESFAQDEVDPAASGRSLLRALDRLSALPDPMPRGNPGPRAQLNKGPREVKS